MQIGVTLLLAIVVGFAIAQAWKIRSAAYVTGVIQAESHAYEQHPENPRAFVLVVGDSTAYGLGASTSTQSIAGRIGADFPNADIRNIGAIGQKLADLKSALSSLENKHYDLMVIQIGANDVTRLTPYADIRTRLREVLALADNSADQVIVLTAGNIGTSPVFLPPVSTYMTHRTRVTRTIFMDEISKHPKAQYVDLFVERSQEPFLKDIERFYAPDKFHPSGDGYGLWYAKLRKLIPESLTR